MGAQVIVIGVMGEMNNVHQNWQHLIGALSKYCVLLQ